MVSDFATSTPLRALSTCIYAHSMNNAFLALQPTLSAAERHVLPSLLSPTTSPPMHLIRPVTTFFAAPSLNTTKLPSSHPQHPPFPPFRPHLLETRCSARTQTPPPGAASSLPSRCFHQPGFSYPHDVHTDGVGVAITIAPVASTLARRSDPLIADILRTHLASIRSKLMGRASSSASAAETTQAVLDNKIALIPFSVNHLGGLGPLALDFLFDAPPPSLNHPPSRPPPETSPV